MNRPRVLTSRLTISVFLHAIFKVPACVVASESSGKDFDKCCISQF